MHTNNFQLSTANSHHGKWTGLTCILAFIGSVLIGVGLFLPIKIEGGAGEGNDNTSHIIKQHSDYENREMEYRPTFHQKLNNRYKWHSYLTSVMFYASISLGGLIFVCMQHLVRAGWSVALRRLAEAAMMNIGLVILLFIPLILFHQDIYLWTNESNIPNGHWYHAWHKKHGYLNSGFFVVRLFIYATAWFFLARTLFKTSIKQDREKDARLTIFMGKLSAAGIIIYALTSTFFSFDMIMSLEYAWFSTMFGVIYFAGSFIALIAFIILVNAVLQKRGYLKGAITTEHRHDLGKWLFAFVIFWAYVSFSQFILIRYPDIPEETVWYLNRWFNGWDIVTWVVFFGHFVIPFFLLLSRHVKRHSCALSFVALYMLFMHYVELYWQIMPAINYPERVAFNLNFIDFFMPIGMGFIFIAGFLHLLKRRNLVAIGDPRLEESLNFHNH